MLKLLIGAGVILLVLAVADCQFGSNSAVKPELPAVMTSVDSGIVKLSGPVQCGEYKELAGDPSVLRESTQYRMFCTGLDKTINGGGIAQATSTDGTNWATVPTGDAETGKGLVLRGRRDKWDYQLETAYAIQYRDKYYLYYCGYPKEGWPKNPGQIGLATSTDGLSFTRPIDQPVLQPSPTGYDANGLYSPAVFHDGTGLGMIYAGHVYEATSVTPGIYLLGATSTDGVSWQKRALPVLSPSSEFSFTQHGVAEPALIIGPDGKYYLLFTGALGDDEARVIAIARADSPFGPYQIRKDPLIKPTPNFFDEKGVLAPTAVLEGGKLRVWYLTSDGDKHMTGYAEVPWPIDGWEEIAGSDPRR